MWHIKPRSHVLLFSWPRWAGIYVGHIPPPGGHPGGGGMCRPTGVMILRLLPCIRALRIRPAPLKFELTNQRWVGGRNCTVLTSSPKPRRARAGRSALASQNSSFRRAACSLSLIIYNKGNGEIFVKSKEELNWSRHLWCWLIVRGVGRSFSSSPFGKFLEKEKRLDACWQTPRTAATLFSVSGLSAVRRKYFLNLRRLNRWRI